MSDFIYYNPLTNPMEQRSLSNLKMSINKLDDSSSRAAAEEEDGTLKQEKTKNENENAGGGGDSAMPVPQLKLNSNGELILDDKSLEIETTAEQEARKVLASSSLIFLDENTGMSGFYKRQKRTKEWAHDETVKFYRCLQTIGTDFSLMCQLFPKRTRRDLKLKFKKEERCNGSLINKALLYPKIFNIDELKLQLETEEHQREEAERRWKEIKARNAKTIKKVNVNGSSAVRALLNGDEVYENENVIKSKLSKRQAKKQPAAKPRKPHKKLTEKINVTLQNPADISPISAHEELLSSLLNSPCGTIESILSQQSKPDTPIKVEHNIIKYEQNVFTANTQLEQELEELLQPEDTDTNTNNNNTSIALVTNEYGHHEPKNVTNNRTLVNLDDGSVTTLNDFESPSKVVNERKSRTLSIRESVDMEIEPPLRPTTTPAQSTDATVDVSLEERDIQEILTELAQGSLVLVSTLDPNNPDKVLNEIYMLEPGTGDLCDSPLDISEEIVQSILSVMS